MVPLLSELHFWTCLEDILLKHTDYGSFKYYSKKDSEKSLYSQSKRQYSEQRNVIWSTNNKRPHKLRDKLRELEEYLVNNKIVAFNWIDNKLKFLLSTGLIVSITVNSRTGDLCSIAFDKQLSTKLQVNIICDGAIIDSQVICICNDGHVLGFGGPWKEGWVLEGGPRRRLNYYGEWLAVWGKAGAEHPQPWSPLAKDHQRANLHLYYIGYRDPELLAYKKTDGEPLQVVVSKMINRTLIVIVQKVSQRGAVSVEVCNFELSGNHLKRTSVTSVPLQTQVSCTALSELEDRLLIGCIDGSLALLDRIRGSTRSVKAAFIPTFAVWHHDGAVVAILNDRGQLQYFDTALNPIKSTLVGDDCSPTTLLDISGYFQVQFNVSSVYWGSKDMIISLEQGPVILLSHIQKFLSFKYIAQRYLNLNKMDKAVNLLLSWKFCEDSFYILKHIVAQLMRQNMTEDAVNHLKNALGSFHSSPLPLPTEVRHLYGMQVFQLTRRFFHQLIRAQKFETAFLLAVDLGHHDLFMDLHYIAVKIGETEMAAAARAQASALLSTCTSEATDCSRSTCSQCSESSSSSNSSRGNAHNPFNFGKSPKPRKEDRASGTGQLRGDNFLTTDFNQPCPTTYKPLLDTNVPVLQSESQKRMSAPRATFVKSPQVPSSFEEATTVDMKNKIVIPPLPNLRKDTSNSIFPQNSKATDNFHSEPFFMLENTSVKDCFTEYSKITANSQLISASISSTISSDFTSHFAVKTPQTSDSKSIVNLPMSVSNHSNSFKDVMRIISPPLPITSSSSETLISTSDCNDTNMYSSVKKHQPKVKFSDTVTAFIVPEIKRITRPVPPPHVTDPQRELADSLPLCHPNEDYLKDFAPVRQLDSIESAEASEHPKIKVVHFGVV